MGLLNTNIWQDHDSELARISYSARMLYLLRGAICLDRMELAKRLGVTWPTASNTAEKLQKNRRITYRRTRGCIRNWKWKK